MSKENSGINKETGHAVREADDALQAQQAVEREHLVLDNATSKRLRWRADLVIMPVSMVCMSVQYLRADGQSVPLLSVRCTIPG